MHRLCIAAMCLTPLLVGCGSPSFLVTPVAHSSELKEEQVQPGKGLPFLQEKIAVIELEGMISNSKSGGLLTATENPLSLFTQQLERAEQDPAVKAIVLRVNSPGGTVTGSDAMYELLLRFRKRSGKPIVSSIQEIGASGAYYISCAADKIVAQPTSLVGSIGVIFASIEFSGTLEKIGARPWDVTSGSLKDMGSPFKPMAPREQAVIQEMVNDDFAKFIGIVREHRKINEPVESDLTVYKAPQYTGAFSGRVFGGNDALKRGLIDQLGLLSDAIDLARSLAHAENASAVMYRRPYGYAGSIYAASSLPNPNASLNLADIPGASAFVPAGFYYLWRPGL